ncbi:hypothetical protein ACEPPN_006094 [Leptodophora sp. 'Broadleaf-Isolate-01']
MTISVKFGIGDATSIGFIDIDILVGKLRFHVFYTGTLFLLSLADVTILALQIQTTLADLQAELQRQRDEITFLRTVIATRTPSKPKPSLPDPEKFNGQAHKYDTWLPSIKAKLQVDDIVIGDATA